MSRKISDILLVSDLDGTLLTDDKRISDKNLEAIRKFEEYGGRFTLATGRSKTSTRAYADIINAKYPCILLNGAYIYDFHNEAHVWNTLLPEASKKYAADVLERFPDVGIEVMLTDMIYVLNLNDYVKAHLDVEHIPHIKSEIQDIPDEWIKILFCLQEDLMDEFSEYMRKKHLDDVNYVRSWLNYFEMIPNGISKGSAIKKLAEDLNVERSNIIAVGDFYNDAEMIEYAGIGVAVENAEERVKDIADMVVCSNEDGAIAQVIDYIFQNY